MTIGLNGGKERMLLKDAHRRPGVQPQRSDPVGVRNESMVRHAGAHQSAL
jgi:hypothetical protein